MEKKEISAPPQVKALEFRHYLESTGEGLTENVENTFLAKF